MTIKTILLTGANGDIATAIGRALGEGLPDVRLVGCDIDGEWPGRSVFAEIFSVPRADNPGYIDALRTVVERVGGDVVLPCTEPELKRLTDSDTAGLSLLMNDTDVVRRCLDKFETTSWLQELGIDVPRTRMLGDAVADDLPVMVKPRTGAGSRGLEIVATPARLVLAQAERDDNVIAQQLLEPNEGEFTCAIFKAYGEVRVLIMRRWLAGGLTERMVVEDTPAIDDALQTIAQALPAIAAINVQLRLVGGVPMVFEINPRLSSTVMMRHRVGFCDALWWLRALEGLSPPRFSAPVGTRVFRTYGETVVAP